MSYLLDSNIVIYFLGGFALSDRAFQKIDDICKEGQQISVISKLELLDFNFMDVSDERETQGFVARSFIVPISPEIEDETIRIRKSVKIKLADAIIAASAVVHNLTLLTRNINDFNSIDGLKIENPFDW